MSMRYQSTQDHPGLIRRLRRVLNGLGNRCECCVCGRTFFRFSPYRGGEKAISAYLHNMDWISSAFDTFWCPWCRSHDRERHLILFFDALGLWSAFEKVSVLHVAPEKQLAFRIAACRPSRYVQGDLVPSREGIRRLDVTRIDAPDADFDCVLCNHVLEHVPEDARALRELYRVLKPGGFAILQTPYAGNLEKTLENQPQVDAPEERLEFYGQEDHVRLYGRDLLDRIRDAGFLPEMTTHEEQLKAVNAVRFGVNEKEPLFLFRKRG